MKKSKMKLLPIVLSIIIFTSMVSPLLGASAAEFWNGDKLLTVEIRYNSTGVRNVEVAICRVATVNLSFGNVRFELVDDFKDVVDDWSEEMNISNEKFQEFANAFARHLASDATIDRIVERTDEFGIAGFEDLENGLYLVMQVNPGRYTFLPGFVQIGRNVEEEIVIPKVEYERERPPRPTPTPTPAYPTPTPSAIPTQTPPRPTPTPTPTELEEPEVPTASFPPEEKPPDDKLPPTGVFNWETVIITLTALGVLFLAIGLIMQKRRSPSV